MLTGNISRLAILRMGMEVFAHSGHIPNTLRLRFLDNPQGIFSMRGVAHAVQCRQSRLSCSQDDSLCHFPPFLVRGVQ